MDVFGVENVSGPNDPSRIKKTRDKKEDVSVRKTGDDHVVISDAAKTAFKDRSLTKMVTDLPEVRKEAVEKAKSEFENGSLFSDEVIGKTADKILKALKED